jgi:hypothetical protein
MDPVWQAAQKWAMSAPQESLLRGQARAAGSGEPR